MARRTKTEAMETRNSLLDAAELLFQQKGVSRTSLQEIASAAGATRGAIYWHFKDKGDLFNAMLDRMTWPLQQPLQQAMERGTPHSLLELRAVYLDAMRLIATDQRLRCGLDIAMYKVEYTEEMGAAREHMLLHFRRGMAYNQAVLQAERTQQQRPLRMPVSQAAWGLHALFVGLLQQWMLDPQAYDLVETCAQSLDTYLRGLGLEMPDASSKKRAPTAD